MNVREGMDGGETFESLMNDTNFWCAETQRGVQSQGKRNFIK